MLPDTVDSLTVPELHRLAKAKANERHFWASFARWFLVTMFDGHRHSWAVGYAQAKTGKLPKYDLEKQLDRAPGWDKKLMRRKR